MIHSFFTRHPTVLGGSLICLVGQKFRKDSGPRGLGPDSPGLDFRYNSNNNHHKSNLL